MNKGKFIADVRHLLDEVDLVSEIAYVEEDALPIDERIEREFCGAWNLAMLMLPWAMLKGVDAAVLTDEADNNALHHYADLQTGTGKVDLPSDYLRLVEYRMRGWKRGVYNTIREDSAEYSLQLNDAMRGGVNFPVVAEVDHGRKLQYFSLPKWITDHTIEVFKYVPMVDNIEAADCDERAYKALCLMTAREVAMSMGRDANRIDERLKLEVQKYGNKM